jgi:hypothetical protein
MRSNFRRLLAPASLALLLLLTGCYSSVATNPTMVPAMIQAPSSPDFAILQVTRDSGFVGSACGMEVYLDGALAARLDTSERTEFKISTGKHILQVNTGCWGDHTAAIEITADKGEMKKYRLATQQDSLSIQPTI